ncbi:hypothetical protein ACI76O_11680 [Capnocytophaga cynodegmi]|uniref:hypothetical protein n=1 Tax=Capnocytophaga cynodegmi TaxID=28189 RepID=UPI001ACA553A|nr:hypothetical protein [Capnocytophaga cynodegmi]GIM53287.1 hypothetical protein CAPN004_23160 [Capnocytophaga cynodegmi]
MTNNKKYHQKKNNIVSEIKNILNNCIFLYDSSMIVNSVEFDKGRDSDNFIIAKLFNKETRIVIEIIFWINFWIDFDFEKDINVIIIKDYNGLYKSISYNEIEGENFPRKICYLFKYIY